jgi:hypothetical protein
MKLIKAAAISFLALIFTTNAAAQNLRASVPFNFAAGEYVLPAGEYLLSIDRLHSRIELRSVDGPDQLFLPVMFNTEGRALTASLMFASYGNAHFLRNVRVSGKHYEMTPSRAERILAKDNAAAKREVALHRVSH